MKENVFVVHTPYHLFLSFIILSSFKESPNTIITIEDAPFNKIIPYLKTNNLTRIVSINGQYGKKNKITRFLVQKMGIKKIKNILSNLNVSQLFVFADHIPMTQFTISLLKNKSKIIKVEDGMEAYIDYYYDKTNRLKLLLKHTLYGGFIEPIERQGMYKYIDELWVLYPQFVSSKLKERFMNKIYGIPRNIDINNIKNIYYNLITSILNLINSFSPIRHILLFLLPHSKVFSLEVKKGFEKLFESVTYNEKNDKLFIVKYHPRETFFYMEEFKQFNNCKFLTIDSFIAAELLFVILKNLLNQGLCDSIKIYSDISTSLLTARWIFGKTDKVDIFSLIKITQQFKFDKFEKIFNALNIKCIDPV